MKLKAYLITHGLTITWLANKLEMSKQNLSYKINGKVLFNEKDMINIFNILKAKDNDLKFEDIFF